MIEEIITEDKFVTEEIVIVVDSQFVELTP